MVKLLSAAISKRLGAALLVGASIAAAGLTAAAATASTSAKACSPATRALSFVSAPNLHPTSVHVCTRKSHQAPGQIFIAPIHTGIKKMVGQPGALLMDQGGHPLWFHPAPKGQLVADFQAATFDKHPVITFWQGKIALPPANTTLPPGTATSGAFYVYDQHYKQIKTIRAQGKGWVTDFHDLVFTPPSKTYSQGTALFLAVKKSSAGGRAFEDEEIQEVNLAAGKLIWSWDVHKFIALKATHAKRPSSGVWDPYHANSLDIKSAGGNAAGNVLLSLRNTWGIYEISHASKKILWRLVNGKGSTYKFGKGAKFYWQHDVHFHGAHQLTIFDDDCCQLPPPSVGKPAGPARGLVLNLKGKTATLAHQYLHPNTNMILTLGSFRYLPGGHAFIGWGQSPYFSEYAATGLIYDAALPTADITYRALKAPWVGLPSTKPSVAVKKANGHTVVYASWNGATTVAKWKVLAGKSSGSVKKAAGEVARSGFETFVRATNPGPYFEVEALNSQGHVIGTSKVVKLS